MNDHDVERLLRLVDDPDGLDTAAQAFRDALREELDETLNHRSDDRLAHRSVRLDGGPVDDGNPRRPLLVAAAIVTLVIGAGAFLTVSRSADPAPADRPAVSQSSVPSTTAAVQRLSADAACARFEESGASALLGEQLPGQPTAAELADAVDAIDDVIASVRNDDAAAGVETFADDLSIVRGAVQESLLLTVDGDVAGAARALTFARTAYFGLEFPPSFDRCLSLTDVRRG